MNDNYNFTSGEAAAAAQAPAGEKKKKEQFTITIPEETARYFKNQSDATGIPVESLMGLCLTDCAKHGRKPDLNWR